MTSKQTTVYSLNDGISIVIPAYNAEKWIIPTTEKIVAAIHKANIKKSEIIIVDDGSTDKTKEVALGLDYDISVYVYSQENAGRFLARKNGVGHAHYDTIFFVDTRVWIDEKSLSYVLHQQQEHPERKVWNGDVEVQKKGNIIARFGDAITQIGWRRYHGKPRLLSYDIKDFDYYPKGTGIFIVPRELLLNAIDWFEKQTKDIKNSSDDTLLIRYIAERERIWISPGFTSIYFARTTLKAFINHTYHRGMFFVDGFLRRGTRFFYPLIGFLLLTFIVPITVIIFPVTVSFILIGLCILWLLEFILAILMKVPVKDALSLFILTPLFALAYGMGIWRAVIIRIINKGNE